MKSRSEIIDRFIHKHGWAHARRTNVAGDASNRRYDRLWKDNGTTAILMDAPSDKGEDVRPFIQIAEYLRNVGLSAPDIFAADTENGLLLIEDLGDDLFARVVVSTPEMERPLYEACVDTLTAIHNAPAPHIAAYDAELLADFAALPFVWYQHDTDAAKSFRDLFHPLCKQVAEVPQVVVLRDYHAENLLWLPDRPGPARVGLLDFQDAMLGHAAYDLVSVLQDARRDVSRETELAMIDRYLEQNTFSRDEFLSAYAILGAQRNLRILGVFSRLCLRDGKAHYVDLIPRVWDHIQTNLRHPALEDVASYLGETLLPPTPETLAELKKKCATRT